jgi:Spy/CpxP family protein refolding chaperone
MKLLKIFRVSIIAVTISLLGTFSTQAQQKMSPDQRVQMRIDKMKAELSLSDDQISKIKPILMDAQQKMMAMRNSGGDPETMKTQRKSIMIDSDKQITALLNPDQQQKYNTMKAQMKEHRMQGGGGQPGE